MPCFGYMNKAPKAFRGNLTLKPFNLRLKLHYILAQTFVTSNWNFYIGQLNPNQ